MSITFLQEHNKQQHKNKNMGLPSTIVAGGFTFDDVTSLNGSTLVYYAASPQGDIAGRPSLRFSQEKTKAGIQRTLVSFVNPVWNSVSEKYVGFIKADSVLNRADSINLSYAENAYDVIHDVMALTSTVTPVLTKGSL